MGVYSTNRTSLGTYNSDEIVANENYVGVVGALQMMTEGFQNDQAIFESVLSTDFMEAMAVNEGVEIEILTEASVSGFIDKIKELLKKAWEKIKGIFASFMAKINGVIIRDNKKFVDKYKKEVLTKNLTKMKYKWSEPNEGNAAKIAKLISDAEANTEIEMGICARASESDLKAVNEKIDSGDLMDDLLSGAFKTDSKSFVKDLHEFIYEDQEEEEGLSSARLTEIMSDLISSNKILKDLNKAKTELDKAFGKLLKAVDKERNDIVKKIPGKDRSEKDTKADTLSLARLNATTKVVSCVNSAFNKITSGMITEAKFGIKQSRRVFAQAAAFNAKAVKENAILVEAAGESAEWEVEASFSDYSV